MPQAHFVAPSTPTTESEIHSIESGNMLRKDSLNIYIHENMVSD